MAAPRRESLAEMILLTEHDIARFHFGVEKMSGGCWVWGGYTDPDGYGVFYVRRDGTRRAIRAHRVSYFIVFDEWPPLVRHTCDNRACVRPEHLKPGTQAQNMRDMVERGRSLRGERHPMRKARNRARLPRGDRHWSRLRPELRARGERHGRASLEADDVRAIRRRFADGQGKRGLQAALAREYSVDPGTVFNIVTGKTWGHIDG